MLSKDIIVIADTQVFAGVPVGHLHSLANFIWKKKPGRIINIGDAFDFPSLCAYNSPREQEGMRLVDDLTAGFQALRIIPDYIKFKNAVAKKKRYRPKLDFITGNHEERLHRMVEKNPHLEGLIDLNGSIRSIGWQVHRFLEPMWVDGIAFNHYMQNPMTGKPIGGAIENKLNKHSHSFVHGHVQQYQYGRRQTLSGMPHFGVCAGAFYLHDEGYRGSYNTEIRGFTYMKHFINRYGFDDYDVDFVSVERLMRDY